MATIKQRTNRDHDMGWKNSCGLLECKLIQSLWIVISSSLEKLKVDLPYVPATPLLGIEPKKSRFTWNSHTSIGTLKGTIKKGDENIIEEINTLKVCYIHMKSSKCNLFHAIHANEKVECRRSKDKTTTKLLIDLNSELSKYALTIFISIQSLYTVNT